MNAMDPLASRQLLYLWNTKRSEGQLHPFPALFSPFYLLTAVSSGTVLCCARPNLQTHSSGSCGRYSSFCRSRRNLDLIDPDLLLFSDHLRSFLAKTPSPGLKKWKNITTLTVSSIVARWPLFSFEYYSAQFQHIHHQHPPTAAGATQRKPVHFHTFDRISMNK